MAILRCSQFTVSRRKILSVCLDIARTIRNAWSIWLSNFVNTLRDHHMLRRNNLIENHLCQLKPVELRPTYLHLIDTTTKSKVRADSFLQLSLFGRPSQAIYQ